MGEKPDNLYMGNISGKNLVERIDQLLKLNGYKGREVLIEKKITKSQTISNWVSGKAPSVYTMYEIANFLGTSIDFLITGEYFTLEKQEISTKSLKVALAAEKLSDEGKKIALTQVEALIAHFPQQTVHAEGTA